jgi:hypothetical protein
MSALRRFFRMNETSETLQRRWREEQFEQVKEGLHEAAQRVNFLELEAEVKARGVRRHGNNQGRRAEDNTSG